MGSGLGQHFLLVSAGGGGGEIFVWQPQHMTAGYLSIRTSLCESWPVSSPEERDASSSFPRLWSPVSSVRCPVPLVG